jgi:hypothetical protein
MRLPNSMRLFAAALLLSVLAACGTSNAPTLPQQPAPPSLNLLPGLDTLPAPQALPSIKRGVSAAVPVDLSAGNTINANATATTLQLTSTAGANSAAYYGVQPTYNGKHIPYLAPYSFTFDHDGAGELWVAFSNYKTGRWQLITAPLTTAGNSGVSVTLTRDAGSPTGQFWFAFISARGQVPTVSNVVLQYPDAPAVATDPVEYQQFIVTSDAKRLATSIYLPYEESSPLIPDPPYPAVLVRTPYDRRRSTRR